jgi:four helix bundle protein
MIAGRERAEFMQRLSTGYDSLSEVGTHTQIALWLNYLSGSDTRKLLDRTGEVGRLLNGLLRYLRLRRQPTSDVLNPTA